MTGLRKGGREKENDEEWIISKYIASVYDDSITKAESY
jgi:hypothetical protein